MDIYSMERDIGMASSHAPRGKSGHATSSPSSVRGRTNRASHSQHRIDQQRRPVYVGGPSQQQGGAPQPQGGIGGFLSSIGDTISNVISIFG